MKITLVCPTNYYGASATRGIYYPLGILLVGSLVKNTFPSWDVEVIDGELLSKSELENKVRRAEILGLSANTCNYQNCLDLANFAKEQGVKEVIMGGPHASAVLNKDKDQIPLARLILKNQLNIDAVIVNEGEKSFLKYLVEREKKRPQFHLIDNLFWREQNEVYENKITLPVGLPKVMDANFSLINLTKYWQEHKKEFPNMDEKYIEGFTHVGCAWREKKGCNFCDIPYPFNNYQSPDLFWRDLKDAKEVLGVKSFKDYGDCLTGKPEKVKELLDARPKQLEDIQFSCYGRSNEITEPMADLLKKLNVKYIYIGFDSGDNRMLKNMEEGYSVKANYIAMERLAKRGINVTGSLILGASGESEETIANTEKFAKEIITYPNLTQLHCAMLTPFPGARMSGKIISLFPKYLESDMWDTEETKRLWIKSYCKASYKYIEEKAREINELNPSSRKRYFGLKR